MDSLMASVIEAKSLSNITALAAEPPDHLDSSAHSHEPLTLYIARVPGSQDVFLTTMKPREKVVTAQDVESCLYYCHLDCEEDEFVRDFLQSEDEAQSVPEDRERSNALSPDQSAGTIRRKSVPNMPQAENIQPQAPGMSHPHFQQSGFNKPPGSQIGRKPVGTTPALPARPHNNSVSPSRKPLGPRPQEAAPYVSFSSGYVDFPGQENARPPPYNSTSPSLPPRTNSDLSTLDQSSNGNPPLPPRRDSSVLSGSTGENFSITLIRRDPTSGDQWNIAKISKEGISSAASLLNGTSESGLIKLEIPTPGYDKFVRPQQSPEGSAAAYMPFERFLQTRRPKSAASSSRKSVFRSSVDVSRSSVEIPPSELPTYLSPNPTNNLSSLCFLSPWNGICEFSTGASGRTLKCRHSPPSAGNEADPQLRRLNSAPVSELRLNMPMIGSSKRQPHSASHSRSSFFQNGGSHRHSVSMDSTRDSIDDRDDWDDAEDDRMDLSLGQERAGGGFGGNKAKLAKLIVEGEGLFMLDLVVAANMGFWWSLKNRRR